MMEYTSGGGVGSSPVPAVEGISGVAVDVPPGDGPRAETDGLRRRAVQGGAIVVTSRLFVQLFAWVVTIQVARILRPYDFGILSMGVVFIGLGDLLAEAGMGRALVWKRDLGPDDVAEGFTLCFALSLGLYAVMFVLAGPAAYFLGSPEMVAFLRVTGLLLLFIPFRAVPMALLDRELRLGRQSAIYVASSLIQSGVVLTMAVAGFGYWALAAGALVGRALEVVALVFQAGWTPRLRMPSARARLLLTFGVHATGSSLLWFVYSNSDFAIVGRLQGARILGLYAFAFQLISIPVHKLTATFGAVSYPVYCRLQHDPARVRSWHLRSAALLIAMGMPALVGLALVAEDAIAVILGPKWTGAVLPLRLLCAAGSVMVYHDFLPHLFNALGRPDINLKFTAVCAAVLPAGFLLMGHLGGLVGICMVWITIYPMLVAGLVALTRPITGFGLADVMRRLAPVLGAVLLMAAAVLLAQAGLARLRHVPLRLALTIAAGVIVYGGGLWGLARQTVLGDFRVLLGELRGRRA